MGTVEYCKYWAELGGGYSTGSALQYPEVSPNTLKYPAVPLSTPQDLQVLSSSGDTWGTGCIANYPPVPFSTL